MAREIKIETPAAAYRGALQELYLHYGHSMAGWAAIERQLYHWFQAMTSMPETMARSIYYGAKGFGARADMLEAAVEHTEGRSAAEIEFIKAAIKKARQYSGFRNKIAHGDQRPIVSKYLDGSPSTLHIEIVQGNDISSESKDRISIRDLSAAGENFNKLAQAIAASIWYSGRPPKLSPEECLALVLQLPNAANGKNVPNTSESEQPPQVHPKRVNKKAFRASRNCDAPTEE